MLEYNFYLVKKKIKTKNLTWCASLKQLPRELISFKYLDNSDCNHLTYMPHELGKMAYLLESSLLIVSKDPSSISKRVDGLGKLNQLTNPMEHYR